MLPPRPLLALCLVLLAGLVWTVEGQPAPRVPLSRADLWEGQRVTIEGWAQGVQRGADGSLRFDLVDGGRLVAVRTPHAALAAGDRLAVTGRLLRLQGTMSMLVEAADDVEVVQRPPAARPSWNSLADNPREWEATLVQLTGQIEGRNLNGEGHAITLGSGPWPAGGFVRADGFLRYESKCLCHAFDAVGVQPWTPST